MLSRLAGNLQTSAQPLTPVTEGLSSPRTADFLKAWDKTWRAGILTNMRRGSCFQFIAQAIDLGRMPSSPGMVVHPHQRQEELQLDISLGYIVHPYHGNSTVLCWKTTQNERARWKTKKTVHFSLSLSFEQKRVSLSFTSDFEASITLNVSSSEILGTAQFGPCPSFTLHCGLHRRNKS